MTRCSASFRSYCMTMISNFMSSSTTSAMLPYLVVSQQLRSLQMLSFRRRISCKLPLRLQLRLSSRLTRIILAQTKTRLQLKRGSPCHFSLASLSSSLALKGVRTISFRPWSTSTARKNSSSKSTSRCWTHVCYASRMLRTRTSWETWSLWSVVSERKVCTTAM